MITSLNHEVVKIDVLKNFRDRFYITTIYESGNCRLMILKIF